MQYISKMMDSLIKRSHQICKGMCLGSPEILLRSLMLPKQQCHSNCLVPRCGMLWLQVPAGLAVPPAALCVILSGHLSPSDWCHPAPRPNGM